MSQMRRIASHDRIHLDVNESDGKKEKVFVITMDRGENRVNPEFVSAMSRCLDVVEKAKHPKSLVLTGTGKFLSNGLDLDFVMGADPKDSTLFLAGLWDLLSRLLVFECFTVCSINGHGFGAGLFFAMACDYRIMRTKRGYLNFPEVNLGMRLQKQFGELAKCKLAPGAVRGVRIFEHQHHSNTNARAQQVRKAVLEAHRFSGDEAKEYGIVDEVVPLENLLSHSVKFALSKTPSKMKFMNFDPRNFKAIKMEMYTDAYRALSTKGLHNPSARL